MKINLIKNRLRINYLNRLLFLFVAFFFFQIQTSQAQQVSLSNSRLTLRTAFTEIEKQTDMSVDYNREMIDVNKTVSIPRKEGSLTEIMTALLQGTGCTYIVRDNHIVISKAQVTVQQNRKNVTGTITDEQGEPIIGANIIEKGTTNGTVTDIDGKFTINVENNAILLISYIGYLPQEVSTIGRNAVRSVLQEDTKSLDEVVVVGFGTQKKRDITGAVVSVKGDVLNEIPVSSIEQSLSGRAAGVQVITGSAAPGGGATIRVRGVGTLNNNEPLYVIDGIILGNIAGGGQSEVSPLSLINPNDIESMDILKDASATAIYGARAGNGVVIITTKRGKGERVNISYDSYYTTHQLDQSKYGLLSGPEWAKVYAKTQENYGATSYMGKRFIDRILAGENIPTYNWVGELMKNGETQSHNLSVSGGNDRSNYFTSLSYFNQEGIIINSDLERFTLRFNSDHKIGNKFKFGNTTLISRTNSNQKGNTYGFDNGTNYLNRVLTEIPYKPIYNAAGYYAGVDSHDPDAEGLLDSANQHTIWAVKETKNYEADNRLWASIYGDLEIIDGLIFHTMGSVDFRYLKYENYRPGPNKILGNMGTISNGMVIGQSERQAWFVENTLTYTKTIKEHGFSGLLGYQAQNTKNTNFFAEDGGFENTDYWFFSRPHMQTEVKDSQGNIIMTLPSFTAAVGNGESEAAYLSWFGRLNYDYKGKYLLTATVRRDASSKFGPDHRWGTFPAVSLGWRLTEENLMKDISWLHNLKLRVGYGVSGSDNVPNYQYASEVGSEGEFNYVFNEGEASGATIARLANNVLRWEEIRMTNIGLDMALFNGRIDITADIFNKNTIDLFLPYAPAFELGMEANPNGNLGEVNNKGFELGIHTINKQGVFSWTTDLNFSTVKNKIISLPQNTDRFFNVNISRVGEEIGAIYGYVADGIFQNWEEVYGHAYQNQAVTGFDSNSKPIYNTSRKDQETARSFTAPGDIKYRDLNGDGIIDSENDRKIIGSTIPDFTWNLSNTLSYKSINLSVFFQGVHGVDIYNGLKTGFINSLRHNELLKAWDGEGSSNTVPRLLVTNPNNNMRASTRFLESGDYIRLKNVRLAYDLPFSVINKIGMRQCQLYVTGTNLLTFTSYSGYDPEIGLRNSGSNETAGVDGGSYPSARQYTMGIKITF